MKTYSSVLFQTCTIDLLMAFVFCFTLIQIETNGGKIYLRSANPFFPSTGYFPCIAIWLYWTTLECIFLSMFVQAVFRYYHIVRYTTIPSYKTWLLHLMIYAISGFITAPYAFNFWETRYNNALADIDPWKYETSLASFRSQNLANYTVIVYFGGLVLITTFCDGILVFCIYKIKKCLKNTSTMYSKQTLRMHKELNRKTYYQLAVPVFSFFVVWFNSTGIILGLLANDGIVLISMMVMQYIIVFNPLITIFTIRAYREVFFKRNGSAVVRATT
uniref:Uncharacterized protein n=1 Tax=Panagrolaimus sp. PS1159 TaxID=55785 RepID=A0AC35GCX1_9BILA